MKTELRDLTMSVLRWWDKHQYDCEGSYNLYNEPPAFVQEALKLFNKYQQIWSLHENLKG